MSTKKRTVEVSSLEYATFRSDMMEQKVFRRMKVEVVDVVLTSSGYATIKGTRFDLSSTGVKELALLFGMSNKMISQLSVLGDNRVLMTLVRQMSKNTGSIVLIYNKLTDVIVGAQKQAKGIPMSQYFDALDLAVTKTPGAYVRSISASVSGGINAVVANPSLGFELSDNPDELFISGFTFNYSLGTITNSFFTERLVCSNGMISKNTMATAKVENGTDLPSFLHDITSAKFTVDNVKVFKARLKRVAGTPASLAEVVWVDKQLEGILGDFKPVVAKNLSTSKVLEHVGVVNLSNNLQNLEYLRSPLSVWELINEVTAVSSYIEQYRMKLSGSVNEAIQVVGGTLLFKKPTLGPKGLKQFF
jgi:hypothetical protein